MKHGTVGMVLVGAVASLVLISGCATSGYQKSDRSTDSMVQTKVEVDSAYKQVTRTITALDTIMRAQVGDLRPLYEDFAAHLKTLDQDAESARSRALSMQSKNQDYFNSWAQEIEAIQDPSVRGKSLNSLKAAKANYQAVEQSLVKTRDAYIPLVSALNDLQTALAQDLTPSGVASLAPAYSKARQQAIDLQAVMITSMKAMDTAVRARTPRGSGASM